MIKLINEKNFEYLAPVELINKLIEKALELKASDIHFEPYLESFRVRFRIDGDLVLATNINNEKNKEVVNRIKVMANLNITEKRKPQDGRILHDFDNRKIDIRVSVLPVKYGEKIVLRLLDRKGDIITLKSLGLLEDQLKIFREALLLKNGIILVTGPTGSGKTTTVYSLLNEINKESKNISTIEDPVEYSIEGINQTMVNEDIGLTFSAVLRSVLRQDPDIIVIGEMRDKETTEIAIRSALTGHLVISTMHTNDAVSTVTRLINMGIDPFLLTASVRFIIAQKLMKVNCPVCSHPYQPDKSLLRYLGLPEDGIYYRGLGCNRCNGIGTKGRTAVFELISLNEDAYKVLTEEHTIADLRDFYLKRGFLPMKEAVVKKVVQGIITVEEACEI